MVCFDFDSPIRPLPEIADIPPIEKFPPLSADKRDPVPPPNTESSRALSPIPPPCSECVQLIPSSKWSGFIVMVLLRELPIPFDALSNEIVGVLSELPTAAGVAQLLLIRSSWACRATLDWPWIPSLFETDDIGSVNAEIPDIPDTALALAPPERPDIKDDSACWLSGGGWNVRPNASSCVDDEFRAAGTSNSCIGRGCCCCCCLITEAAAPETAVPIRCAAPPRKP